MKTITRHEFALIVKDAGIKPRLRRDLRFVPEEITDWQDRDFIAVTNRSGSEGVVIAPLTKVHVAAFELQRRSANSKGRVEPVICDICATWQRGSGSAIITFKRERSTQSFLCCDDLLCSLHVRDKTTAAKLSRTQLRETNDTASRIERLQQHLTRLLQQFE